MKQVVIILAKSVEEARQKAATELNLPPAAINISKLDEAEKDVLDGATPLEARYRAEVRPERLLKLAQEKLAGLLKAMGILAEIRANLVGYLIHLQVMSPEKTLLIGRRGATLEAISHLINRIVNGGDKDLPYVFIDVEGYNDRRYQRLEREAMNAVQKAKTGKQRVILKPMKPDDRKVIHNFVKGIQGVTSFSQGEEGKRQVVIAPLKGNRRNDPQLISDLF